MQFGGCCPKFLLHLGWLVTSNFKFSTSQQQSLALFPTIQVTVKPTDVFFLFAKAADLNWKFPCGNWTKSQCSPSRIFLYFPSWSELRNLQILSSCFHRMPSSPRSVYSHPLQALRNSEPDEFCPDLEGRQLLDVAQRSLFIHSGGLYILTTQWRCTKDSILSALVNKVTFGNQIHTGDVAKTCVQCFDWLVVNY